jgi:aldose 1-epimerase
MLQLTRQPWGVIDGRDVLHFTLQAGPYRMGVTNYGGIVTHLFTPDRQGKAADVVLGFDSLDGYVAGHPYFGALVGRCANRINQGRCAIAGHGIQLARNHGPHHLHGGGKGFDKYVWDAATDRDDARQTVAITFTRTSPRGEENYPGQLHVTVTYTLAAAGRWRVDMQAVTDAATVCNLAQHTYWNLAGHDGGSVLEHVAAIDADGYTPVSDQLIPTGAVVDVTGTPFDFRTAKPIGRDAAATGANGYDHNFALNGTPGTLRHAVTVSEPRTGRGMELWTDQVGVQFYTANMLAPTAGKAGRTYDRHGGFCLETQAFPDSINHDAWRPHVLLKPGQPYRHVMEHRFTTG